MPSYEPVESPDGTTVFSYHDLSAPTTADVWRARRTVHRYLPRTPLVRSEHLSAELDADVYLKREETLPTGAFKVRGGLNLVAHLDPEFREDGLIAASTGNHGQSIAWAGREFDVPVTIGVPDDANPDKVAAIERLGADVVQHGETFDDARERVEELAAEEGYRYVHSANEPALIAGVGTAGLEVVEDCPDVDVVFSPIGGGSSAAGYCLTVGAMTDADVVGVQSGAAPALQRAWSEGHLETHERMDTVAEGLATRVPFAVTMDVLRERLDDFRLVSEESLREAVVRLFAEDHIVVEGAGAAGVAAAIAAGDSLAGETVVIPLTGRNLDRTKLEQFLAESEYID